MSHNISEEEIYSFTQYLNINLKKIIPCRKFLPINPESNDIFDRLWESQGQLLQSLILQTSNDQRAMKQLFSQFKVTDKENTFQTLQNFNICIEVAKQIGCKIIGVSGEDFKERKQYLILAVLWQVIRKCLSAKVQGKSQQIKDEDIEPIIIQWANGILHSTYSLVDFTDIVLLNSLMRSVAVQNLIDVNNQQSSNSLCLSEEVLSISDQLGIERFIRSEDLIHKNSKIILSFLAEVFGQVISQEITLGQDTASEQANKISVVKDIKTNFKSSIIYMSFKNGMTWDQSRANGHLDIVELSIFILSLLESLQIKNLDEFQSIQYSFLLPNLTDKQLMQLVLQTVKLLRDCLDLLLAQQDQNMETYRLLITSLMVLFSVDYIRIELQNLTFTSTFKRLLKIKSKDSFVTPILLFGHMLDLESETQNYKDTFKEFYNENFIELLTVDFEEKIANLYSLQQLNLISAENLIMQLELSFSSLYSNLSNHTVQSLSLFLNTYSSSTIYFDRKKDILKQCMLQTQKITINDASLGTLLQQQNINFLSYLLNIYPEKTLNFIVELNILDLQINEIKNIDYQILNDSIYQRQIYSAAYVIKHVRQALILLNMAQFETIDSKLTFKQSTFDDIYTSVIENQLGNESLRSSARYLVSGLLKIDNSIIKEFVNNLELSAKSSSYSAFIQSLKDIQICCQNLVQDDLINVLNWIFAGLSKFQDIELVVSQVLLTVISIAQYMPQQIIMSLSLNEITEQILPWINQRSILLKYLTLIQTLAKQPSQCLPAFMVSFRILQRIPTQFLTILPQYYETLTCLANSKNTAKYFQTYLCFWDNIIDHMSSGILIAREVAKCILKVIGCGYILYDQACQIQLFQKIEMYAKGYGDEIISNIITEIVAYYVYYQTE